MQELSSMQSGKVQWDICQISMYYITPHKPLFIRQYCYIIKNEKNTRLQPRQEYLEHETNLNLTLNRNATFC